MITVKPTDQQSFEVHGRDIRGISLIAVLLANAAGTAMTGVLVDQTKIRLKAIVKRKDKAPQVIYNDQVILANALSTFFKPNFEYLQSSTKDVQLANATGVTEKAVLPMLVDFGNVVHLEDGDSLLIEVTTSGFTSDSSVSSTTSFLEVAAIDGTDVEDGDSEIVAFSIQASKTNDTIHLGNGVTDVMFFNIDKTSILDADAPLSALSFDSKQVKLGTLTQNTLLGLRNAMFPTKAVSDVRYQSFMIYSGPAVDDAKVEATFNSSNVNASKNYIIVRRKKVTPTTYARTIRHSASQEIRTLNKAGQTAQVAKVANAAAMMSNF